MKIHSSFKEDYSIYDAKMSAKTWIADTNDILKKDKNNNYEVNDMRITFFSISY